ncbi:MAG: hypothetical protein WC619_02980 [Patescibacteria group bacterium]
MAQLVKKDQLSGKSGLVATSRTPFPEDEIRRLTAKLERFALVQEDEDLFQIFGE